MDLDGFIELSGVGDQLTIKPRNGFMGPAKVLVSETDSSSGRSIERVFDVIVDLAVNAVSPIQVSPDSAAITRSFTPVVARAANGSSIVVWTALSASTSWDIYAIRYDANGNPLPRPSDAVAGAGAFDFRVNATDVVANTSQQKNPAIAINDNAQFVIAWEEQQNSSNSAKGIRIQRFAASGVRNGTELALIQDGVGNPTVAIDNSGKVTVAWDLTSRSDIFLRQINWNESNFLNSSIKVNDYSANGRIVADPQIGVNKATGDFTIIWNSFDQLSQSTAWDVIGKRFSSSGMPLARATGVMAGTGDEFVVNSDILGANELAPAIAKNGNGFVISWQSNIGVNPYSNVFARVFDSQGLPSSPSIIVSSPRSAYQGESDVTTNDLGFEVVWESRDTVSETTATLLSQSFTTTVAR